MEVNPQGVTGFKVLVKVGGQSRENDVSGDAGVSCSGRYGDCGKAVVVDKNRAIRDRNHIYGSIEALHQKSILVDFITNGTVVLQRGHFFVVNNGM